MKTKEVSKIKGYKGLKKLIPFYKKYTGLMIFTICFLLFSAIIAFFSPIFSANSIACISAKDYNNALMYLGLLLLVRVLISVFNYMYNISYTKMNTSVVHDIKSTLIQAITNVSMRKDDQTNSGIYIERLHGDTIKCGNVLLDIMSIILGVISNFGFLIYIAFINIFFFIAMVAYIIVLWIFDNIKERVWYKQSRKTRELRDLSTGSYNEIVRGLRDVKSLNIKNITVTRASGKFNSALKQRYSARKTRQTFVFGRNIFAIIFEVGFLLMGILFIKNAWISLANFLIIYMYHSNVRSLSTDFATIKQYATEGELSAQRVFEIIDDFEKEQFGNNSIENVVGNIEFKDVNFEYIEGKPVLNHLTASFETNKTTAIVGKSGSGKSTILSLINKLYTINNGSITLDGVDINTLDEQTIRNNIGVVTQSPYIFNCSIRENLNFIKPDATDDEMIDVLKRAQIYDFISTLENGLDSTVGENGVMLSGGQKQRLAIARILLKNSKVIVLDEATSALDNESQSKIVNAINELKKDHTIIIVAHRLSTIVDADKIMVLSHGEVIDTGTHKELYKKCKLYKELYQSEELSETLREKTIEA